MEKNGKSISEGIEIKIEDGLPSHEKTEGIQDQKSGESDLQERYIRLQAEFANYKRRTDKERLETRRVATGELIADLLPVLDDLERLIRHHEGEESCPLEGVKLIVQKLNKRFMDAGLEPVPSVGCAFNPDYHEAVEAVPTDQGKNGMVIEEWERGYRLGERLIRPGRVRVGKYIENKED